MELGQNEDVALLIRELGRGAGDGATELGAVSLRLRRVRGRCGHLRVERYEREPALSTRVDRDAARDREKPGRNARRASIVEARQRTARAEERLSCQVLDMRSRSERP